METAAKDKERAGIVKPEKGAQSRNASIDIDSLQVEDYTIKGVSIATDTPVMRSFGEERLLVTKEAARFSETLPLLINHNPNSRRLGSVKNIRVTDGVVRADIEFDKNYDEAVNIFKSITVDKQRQDLSIGYMTNKYNVERVGETLAESHTITEYEIYDVSVVGRGADPDSGFHRSASDGGYISEENSSIPMTDQNKAKNDNAEVTVASDEKDMKNTRSASTNDVPTISTKEIEKKTRANIAALFDLGQNHNIDQETVKGWIESGTSLSDAKDQVLGAIQKRAAETPAVRFTDGAPKEDEVKYKDGKVELSMRGAIDALISAQLGEANISPEASLARDVSKQLGGGTGLKMRMPFDALHTRAFEAGANKQGGVLIQDTVRMDMFQRFLYQNTVYGKLGLKTLTGLTDNVSIPRQTKTIAANYVGEGSKATAADMEASAVTVSPHTCIALTKITGVAKAQMPGVQSILQDDLLTQLRIAVDRTTLIGGGTNEPTGIMATSGVSNARSGAKGSATRKFAIEDVLDLLEDIQSANVIGNPKIVAPPAVINYWRKQKTTNGDYLWSNNTDRTTVMDVPGYLWGVPVYRSTNLRLAADAATDNRVLIGVFEYAVSAFFGSSFQIEVGTTGDDFAADTAAIRAVLYNDTAVIRSAAFEGVTAIEV